MSFEANQGQTDTSVNFLSRGSGYTLFLTPNEAVLRLKQAASEDVLRMQLVGANPTAQVAGLDVQSGTRPPRGASLRWRRVRHASSQVGPRRDLDAGDELGGDARQDLGDAVGELVLSGGDEAVDQVVPVEVGERPTDAIPEAPGHPFYRRLNALLVDAGFDSFVEQFCLPCYAQNLDRPGIPPGTRFRVLFIDCFEGIDSQRGIAWRCADSRSLPQFLGLLPIETTPDHSSLTRVRKGLVHENVFAFVLKLADEKGLLHARTVGVDSTLLEANPAMKSLTRRDTGDDYQTYLRKLAAEAGMEDPTDEKRISFDRNLKGKTMSNEDWESPSDQASKIAKMKDGTTHDTYKAEHVVDLESDLLLAAEIHAADRSDASTAARSVLSADFNLMRAGNEATKIEEMAADRFRCQAGSFHTE